MILSVVVPFLDEAAVLPETVVRLERLFGALGDAFSGVEAVFVDDGSRDDGVARLEALAVDRPWLRVLVLSRNFGHQAAVTAGLREAVGDAVVVMDADLQDPPECVLEMVRLWRDEGFAVVYGLRTARAGESWFKRASAAAFYRLLRRLTRIEIPADVGDFRLMDRQVVDALNAMGEHHRFLRGMAAWTGFRQTALPYARAERAAGTTKYPLRKMVRLAVDAVCGFSHAPLRLATGIGVVVALASLGYGAVTVVRYLLSAGRFEPGWASLIVVVTFLSGVQLVTLGMIGEYLGRVYDEVKGRPLYLVARRIGVTPTDPEAPSHTRP